MKRPVSYVGVTGFMTPGEVSYVLEGLPEVPFREGGDPGRRFMIGVLVSWKTLAGIAPKLPNRYPHLSRVGEILPQTDHEQPRTLNFVHYNTKDSDTLVEQLDLIKRADYKIHGFQLNMAWPSPGIVARCHGDVPGGRIILQIGGNALEAVGNQPHTLVAKLREYVEVVDYILLDPSGGLGKSFDPEEMRAYLDAIYDTDLPFGVGVAGGLSASTIEERIGPLAEKFPDLSIDAEGQLRTPHPEDRLDVMAARAYVEKAFALLR